MVTFSDKPEVLADFTPSVEDIQSKLVYAVPKGRTALLDAIYLGMNRMRKAHDEKKGAAHHLRRRRQPQPLHRG